MREWIAGISIMGLLLLLFLFETFLLLFAAFLLLLFVFLLVLLGSFWGRLPLELRLLRLLR